MASLRQHAPHIWSRRFLAFIAFLFSLLLCLFSLNGGAFGAVLPQEAHEVLSVRLALEAVHPEMSEKGLLWIRPANKESNLRNDLVRRDVAKHLERILASRLAVGRAA